MVGKNNRLKDVEANEKTHYKSYKSGKRWVFASIASLSLGAVLFFGTGLNTHADSSSNTSNTTASLSDSTASTAAATSSAKEVALSSSFSENTGAELSSSDSESNATATTEADGVSTTATADSSDDATTVVNDDSSSEQNSPEIESKSSTETTNLDDSKTVNVNDSGTSSNKTEESSEVSSEESSEQSSNSNSTSSDTDASDVDSGKTVPETTKTPTGGISSDSSNTDSSSILDENKTETPSVIDDVPGEVSGTPTIADDTLNVNKLTLINPTEEEIDAAKETMEAAYKLTGQAQQLNALLDEAAPSASSAVITLTSNTDVIGYNSGQTSIILTFTVVGAKAGDVYTITIPKTSVFSYSSMDKLTATQGTSETQSTADGGTMITVTMARSVSDLSFKIKLGTANNENQQPRPMSDVGVNTYTITAMNGDTEVASIPITQTITPTISMGNVTRTTPNLSELTAVQSGVDYIYTLKVNEADGVYNDGSTSSYVNAAVNYGTTITIPVPEGFTLNSDVTNSINGFSDETTISQPDGSGTNVIITVPKGSGKETYEGGSGYKLVGSYDVAASESEQTLTASGPVTITQVIDGTGTTITDESENVFSETLAASTEIPDASNISISMHGNSSSTSTELALDGDTTNDPKYLTTYSLTDNSAISLTDDLNLTINVPDGIEMTSLTVPAEGATTSQYLPGTTSYAYQLTLADGSIENGEVDAGGTITANYGSEVRQIVLTPNYLAAGAYTSSNAFILSGIMSSKYDDGSDVQYGDTIDFTSSLALSSDPSTIISSDSIKQTVIESFAHFYAYLSQSDKTPGAVAAGSLSLRMTGQDSHTTYEVYEPIFYYVLPSATYISGFSAIDSKAKVTEFQADDGRTVVQIDYSGTGEYVSTNSTFSQQVKLSNYADALPGSYGYLMYVYSPVTKLANTKMISDTSYSAGNAEAVEFGSGNWTISSASTFDQYSFGQANEDVQGVTNATSDDQGSSDATFYVALVNTLRDGTDNTTTSIINLPTLDDANGSGYTFNLTGPVTLPTNFITATGTGDTIDATVLYSTATVAVTQGQKTIDTSSYVSADEVTSWDSIRSVLIKINNFGLDDSTGKIALNGTIADMQNLAGMTGYLQAIVLVNDDGASVDNSTSLSITGTSTVTARFHYIDDNGEDQYITLDDLKQTDLQDNVDSLQDIYPTNLDGFSAVDQALIPEGYTLASNQYTYVSGANADGIMSSATTKVGDTAVYNTDGEIVQYELAKNASLTVTYIDDAADGAVVGDVTTVTGLLGASDTYKVVIPNGYELASGQASSIGYTLSDSDTDNLTVHLVHQITVIGTKTTTNTVTYTGLPTDKTPASQSEKVSWNVEKDDVTGEVTYVPSSTHQTTYTTTNVSGYYYDSSQAQVGFTVTTQTTEPKDQSIEVAYYAETQTTNIEFVDDDNNSAVVGTQTVLQGKTDENVPWSVSVPDNYVLASGQSSSGTYTFKASDNDNIIVHLSHIQATGTTTTTRNIYFIVEYNNSLNPEPVNQTAMWNVTKDMVTGAITATTTDSYNQVDSLPISGYTANTAIVPSENLEPITTLPANAADIYVTYTADAQTVSTEYVDDSASETIVGTPKIIDGYTGTSTNWDTSDLPAGYQLAANQPSSGTYTFTAEDNQVVQIHVVHIHTQSEMNTNDTVNYYELPQDKAEQSKTESVNWKIDTDEATGISTFTPSSTAIEISTPEVPGYTPSEQTIKFTQATSETQPSDQTADVTYSADPQEITFTYFDDTTGDEMENLDITLEGHTDEAGTYTVIVPKNYVLSQGQSATVPYTYTADVQTPTEVHLTHAIADGTVVTTRTITYVVDGNPTAAPKAVVQKITWKVVRDMVTGTSYAIAQNGYDAVITPELAGYTADKSGIAQELLGRVDTADLADSAVTVTYTAIPVAPDNDSENEVVTPTQPDTAVSGTMDSDVDNEQSDVTVLEKDNQKVTRDGNSDETTKSNAFGSSAGIYVQGSTRADAVPTVTTDDTGVKKGTANKVNITTAAKLPQTDEKQNGIWTIAGASLLGLFSLFGIGKKKRREDD